MCIVIDAILGMMPSFLGIGPINLIVLFHFFSMDTKKAAENSLYVILLSQLASLQQSVLTNNVPEITLGILLLMIIGGISGEIAGRKVNKGIAVSAVEKLFIGVMVLLIGINIYNIFKFLR